MTASHGHGTNHSLAGASNRRLVLSTILRGVGTRPDLARNTGLRLQTISNITRELINAGFAREAGAVREGLGKPTRTLGIVPESAWCIGVHLERETLRLARVNLAFETTDTVNLHIRLGDPRDAVEAIARQIGQLMTESRGVPPWGVGLALPILVHNEQPEFFGDPHWRDWAEFPIAPTLREACGIPVVIQNDATSLAMALKLWRAGADLTDVGCLLIGHGLGAGVISGGRPVCGRSGNAGEVGRVVCPPMGDLWDAACPADRGSEPTIEDCLSLDGLTRALVAGGTDPELDGDGMVTLPGDWRSNGHLQSWLTAAGRRLRLAVNIMENLFDPQTILLAGMLPMDIMAALCEAAHPLASSVRERRRQRLPRLDIIAPRATLMAHAAGMLPFRAILETADTATTAELTSGPTRMFFSGTTIAGDQGGIGHRAALPFTRPPPRLE